MRAMESSRELGERSENVSRSDQGTSWSWSLLARYGWRRVRRKVWKVDSGHGNDWIQRRISVTPLMLNSHGKYIIRT